MNDMKFTTAGDYMADYDGMLGTTDSKNFISSDIEENAPSGNYLAKARDRWRESKHFGVEREVAEIINTILLRENALMRFELNMKFPWETE